MDLYTFIFRNIHTFTYRQNIALCYKACINSIWGILSALLHFQQENVFDLKPEYGFKIPVIQNIHPLKRVQGRKADFQKCRRILINSID